MKTLLRKVPDLLGKRKHSFSQQLSNFKASSKTLKIKGTMEEGQSNLRTTVTNTATTIDSTTVQRRIPTTEAATRNQRNTDFLQNTLQVKNFDLVKKYF